MSEIAGKTEPDPRTGWWRECVWEGDSGMFGDDSDDRIQVGTAYEAVYTDGRWRSIVYYAPYHVIAHNQPDSPWRYVVEGMAETWKIDIDADDYDRGSDRAEIEYGLGSVLYYETEEQAQAVAKQQALNDESYTYFNTKETA